MIFEYTIFVGPQFKSILARMFSSHTAKEVIYKSKIKILYSGTYVRY